MTGDFGRLGSPRAGPDFRQRVRTRGALAQRVRDRSYARHVGIEVAIAGVLVVDDNAENRALAAATLGDKDIGVVIATNGEEAIASLRFAH